MTREAPCSWHVTQEGCDRLLCIVDGLPEQPLVVITVEVINKEGSVCVEEECFHSRRHRGLSLSPPLRVTEV